LTLHDDGHGFEVSKNDGDFDWQKTQGSNGLLSMRRRAEELGGEFLIESKIGQGTKVNLHVPLP
jgi:signal transduction histidine kinase